MKTIKSKSYIKKEAIWSGQDPHLPPGVSQNDIDESFGGPDENIVKKLPGEIDIKVNWQEFGDHFKRYSGEVLPSIFANRHQPSDINLQYSYSYDYNKDLPSDIKPVKLKDYQTGKVISDPYLVSVFVEYYKYQIEEKIKELEGDAKTPDF